MSEFDKKKWNEKFRSMPDLLAPRAPSALVERFYPLAKEKRALDLACGGGRHTLFLSQKGFSVDAVDISEVALSKLAAKIEASKVALIEADLDQFTPKKEGYDLIVKTNYLDRDLIKRAQEGLMAGGIFIVETYMADSENEKKDSNPDFLLQKGELLELFAGFEILEYQEFWNESYEKYRMKKQGIVAQRI